MKTQIRPGDRPFYDDIHFPKGFNRSGEFTVKESNVLTDYGHTLKSLFDGSLPPVNIEETRFIEVFSSNIGIETVFERTWEKYLKVISPKALYTLNSSSNTDFDTNSNEYNLEL